MSTSGISIRHKRSASHDERNIKHDYALSSHEPTTGTATEKLRQRPTPIDISKTNKPPLQSAPLQQPATTDIDPSPLRKSQSANSSPTRLDTPTESAPRRSSDSGKPTSRPRSITRRGSNADPALLKRAHAAATKPLSRTSSLKKAALGKASGLSTLASMMQSPSFEALIKGRRRSRRVSDASKSKGGRSASVPTSATRSRSESPAGGESSRKNVIFQQPKWSANEPNRSSPLSEERTNGTAEHGNNTTAASNGSVHTSYDVPRDRKISFGTLPQRQSIASEEVRTTPETPKSTEAPKERKISFASLPERPPVEVRHETEEDPEEGLNEELQNGEEEGGISDEESKDTSRVQLLKPEHANDGTDTPIRGVSPRRIKAIPRPTFTVTAPSEEKVPTRKIEVHPNTSYSRRASAEDSSSSDSEDMGDIRKAQRLSINQSVIDNSIKHRSIRTIIRGDFSNMQKEAEEGHRRLRTYLVATDLSGEAAYALEWTIGTVLRDGDTLIAVYAVDQETGTGKVSDTDSVKGVPLGEEKETIIETQDTIGKLSDPSKALVKAQSPLVGRKSSATPAMRDLARAEQERVYAIEGISQTCIKFLRKTKLQVRIGVEVVHCESPRHMITEAIDELEPTMCIVGSRGQSSMKGVLLGSFSNYLVMKSSAPVMVARKKLRAVSKTPKVRLSNNLTPNKRPLSEARID